MRKKFLLLVMTLVLIAAGCGDKKGMDYKADLTNEGISMNDSTEVITENSSEVAEGNGNSDAENKNENVVAEDVYIVTNDEVKYSFTAPNAPVDAYVDATVDRQGASGYPEATLVRKEFTIEEIKSMADAFFDNADYMQVINISDANKEYAENRLNILNSYENKYVDETGKTLFWIQIEKDKLELVLEKPDYKERTGINITEGQLDYVNVYDNELNEIAGRRYITLEGVHDNMLYKMDFEFFGENTVIEILRLQAEYEASNMGSINEDDLDKVKKDLGNQMIGLKSYDIVDKDKAISLATEYAEKLGFKDYAVVKALPTVVIADEHEGVADAKLAYNVVFSKEINGKTKIFNFDICGRNDSSHFMQQLWYSNQVAEEQLKKNNIINEYLSIQITDDGLFRVAAINPLEVESVVNEESTLMSFEDINKIAFEKLKEKEKLVDYDAMATQGMKLENKVVDKISLGLAEQETSDGLKIVPAWYYNYEESYDEHSFDEADRLTTMFFTNDSLKKKVKSAIRINAITGEVIE